MEKPRHWEKMKLMNQPLPYPIRVKKIAIRVLKPIVMARTLRIFFPLITFSDVTMLTIPVFPLMGFSAGICFSLGYNIKIKNERNLTQPMQKRKIFNPVADL
jgi:hypothetical protein